MSHTQLHGVDPAEHKRRRAALCQRKHGPILLLGNGVRARNLPMTPLPFRQDSTFLYFTGCALPDAALLLLDGESILYLPAPAEDDPLWHGEVEDFHQLRSLFSVDRVVSNSRLERALRRLTAGGQSVATIAIPDEAKNAWASPLVGTPLRFGSQHGDRELVTAVIELRRTKSDAEIALFREAAISTTDAHLAVAAAAKPGVAERALSALFTGVLAARGCSQGYGTILTQRGEVLHNFHHDGTLAAGALLLVDGGGEVSAGYGCDVTRTWPVGGTFSPRQRGAYEAVLQAQIDAIARCRVGVGYREVHDTACLTLARFLADEGLLKVTPEVAVEAGAHALFFPHGTGHLLGLDVHDLENFGDLPAYPPNVSRPDAFGTCYLRLDLPLERNWIVTVEPGFYVVPAILNDPTLRERFSQMVDFERAGQWSGFGGIRIEDDIAITDGVAENLTFAVPTAVDDVENAMQQALSLDIIVAQSHMNAAVA